MCSTHPQPLQYYQMNSEIDNLESEDTLPNSGILTSCGSLPINRFGSLQSINQQQYSILHHKVMDPSTIYQNILGLLDEVVEKTYLDQDLVLLLLCQYQWDPEILQNSYFQEQTQVLWAEKLERKVKQSVNQEITEQCSVCLNAKPILYSSCSHGACLDCWRSYFEVEILDKAFVKCINGSCPETLYHSFVLKILNNTDTLGRYILRLVIEYADTVKTISACPGPDCQLFFEDTSLLLKSIHCQCGTRYCFKCKQEPHEPCSCKEKERWMCLTMSQKPNEAWIKAHTKECPGCSKHIEKSLGCNLMVCKCGFSFCYLCSREWSEFHNDHFRCPYQNPQNEQTISPVKSSTDDITQTYSQFIEINCLQLQSLRQSQQSAAIQKSIQDKLSVSVQDTLFLKQLWRVIIKGYNYLKWTLVLFYLKKDSISFEDLLEYRLQKLKEEIEKCSHLVKEIEKKVVQWYNEETQEIQNKGCVMKMFYHEKDSVVKSTKLLETLLKQFITDVKNI